MVNPKVCDAILFIFAIILLIVAALLAACISLILPRKSLQSTRTLNEIEDTDFDPSFDERAWLNSLRSPKKSRESPDAIVSISISNGEPKNTKLLCTGMAISENLVKTCQQLVGKSIPWPAMTVRSESIYFSHHGKAHKITKNYSCTLDGLEDIVVLQVEPNFSKAVTKGYEKPIFGGIANNSEDLDVSGFGGDIVATEDVHWNDTIFLETATFEKKAAPLCSDYIENCRWTKTINDSELHEKCSIRMRVSSNGEISSKKGYVGGNGRVYYQEHKADELLLTHYYYSIFGIQVNPVMSTASPDRDIIYLGSEFATWIEKNFGLKNIFDVKQEVYSRGKKLQALYQTTDLGVLLRNWNRYYENEFYGMPLKNIWYVYENYSFFTNDPLDMPFPPCATEDQTIAQFNQKSMIDAAIETEDYDLSFVDHSGLNTNDEDIYISPVNDDTLLGSGMESGSGML